MNKILIIIDKVFEWASALILGLMMILMALQVLFRYVLNSPLAWSEELARFAFIWMTFIAGYLAARNAEHVAITAVQDRLPIVPSKIIKLATNWISTLFFGIIAFYCIEQWKILSSQTSSAMKIPMSMVYLGMIIGAVFIALAYFITGINSVTGKVSRE